MGSCLFESDFAEVVAEQDFEYPVVVKDDLGDGSIFKTPEKLTQFIYDGYKGNNWLHITGENTWYDIWRKVSSLEEALRQEPGLLRNDIENLLDVVKNEMEHDGEWDYTALIQETGEFELQRRANGAFWFNEEYTPELLAKLDQRCREVSGTCFADDIDAVFSDIANSFRFSLDDVLDDDDALKEYLNQLIVMSEDDFKLEYGAEMEEMGEENVWDFLRKSFRFEPVFLNADNEVAFRQW